MESSISLEPGAALLGAVNRPRKRQATVTHGADDFRKQFTVVFEAQFQHVYRYLARLSGDPDMAAGIAQDAFVKLYKRGEFPDDTDAWLITVATNLFRNAMSKRSRRRRLLTTERGRGVLSDPPPSPIQQLEAGESKARVRLAVDSLDPRSRQMLLLRAEGYSYKEIASVLELNEASVGTLLGRAKKAFKRAYAETLDAR